LPAALLAASLVSFACRRLARRATHCVTCFFPLSTSYPPRRLLHPLLLSLGDFFPVAPLTESLVSFASPRLARRAAH
jgi:hypothetical protein